jgi:hypothetical protein
VNAMLPIVDVCTYVPHIITSINVFQVSCGRRSGYLNIKVGLLDDSLIIQSCTRYLLQAPSGMCAEIL